MGVPPEHATFLRRGPYPVDRAISLDGSDRELLSRYGYWLEALAIGAIAPSTPEQVQFVRVARGEAEPQSAFEVAWARHRRGDGAKPKQVGPLEIADRLERLQETRMAVMRLEEEHQVVRTSVLQDVTPLLQALETEYADRRAAIMKDIEPQLEAVDAEFASKAEAATKEVERLDGEVREAVLEFGASFKHAGVSAVYVRPPVKWDRRGLDKYAEAHPEVATFRSIGKPSVRIKFEGPPRAGHPENA